MVAARNSRKLWASLLFITVCLISFPVHAQYGGGNGTTEDPYLIYTAEQLNTIGLNQEDADKHFKLMADIDLSAYKRDTFNRIGYYLIPPDWRLSFSGVFDGNNHTISNFTYVIDVNEPPSRGYYGDQDVGLFGIVNGVPDGPQAQIKNLGLIDPNIYPAASCSERVSGVGAIAGRLSRGSITNCYVEGGRVSADISVGGLVGSVSRMGTISNCYTTCDVTWAKDRWLRPIEEPLGRTGSSFGGLVGDTRGQIYNCYATGTIEADSTVGGLVGYNGFEQYSDVVISDSYATGDVSGVESVGGLVGENSDIIRRCYALGSVSGLGIVGGLVGINFRFGKDQYVGIVTNSYTMSSISGNNHVGGMTGVNMGMLITCYSAGEVSGASNVGGLVGTNQYFSKDGTADNCFWDQETSRQWTSKGGKGKTTEQMQDLYTYLNAGWDFVDETANGTEDIWKMCCEQVTYPKLAWSFPAESESIVCQIPAAKITPTASSSAPDNDPNNTINNSGFDVRNPDLHSSLTSDMWVSSGADIGPVWIQYDFDKTYKLHEMLVWNYNGESILTLCGFKKVDVEYSSGGINWSKIPDVFEFSQATGRDDYTANTIVSFNGVATKHVRITAAGNWSNGIFPNHGLSEVRFLYMPVRARFPSPQTGAKDVPINVVLSWTAGVEAAEHKLYLSTDEQAVSDGTAPVNTVTKNSNGPLSLDIGSTYYWRVNEVNDAEAITTWPGDIWSFSTEEYFVVDDFESYNDIPEGQQGSDLIYDTWKDGFDDPSTNGSTIGYVTGLSMELNIVHSGDQSMPFSYNNAVASFSEATANISDLTIGQDWIMGSANVLSLWFYGNSSNAPEPMYVSIANDGSSPGRVYYDDPNALLIDDWKEWIIDLKKFSNQGVNLTYVDTISIGFGDKNNPQLGGEGSVHFDDIHLHYQIPHLEP